MTCAATNTKVLNFYFKLSSKQLNLTVKQNHDWSPIFDSKIAAACQTYCFHELPKLNIATT